MSDQQSVTAGASVPALHLSLDIAGAKSEAAIAPAGDPALDQRADEFVQRLLDFASHGDGGDEASAAIAAMGRDLQREASQRSHMLKQPIMALGHSADDGGPVAKGLVDLRMQVEGLDPAKFDLEPGWVSRSLGFIPGIGNPIKRYFMRFESAQTVIDAIIASLKKGREQLGRDNVTLAEDQKAMRALTHKLARQVSLAEMLDRKLEAKRDRELAGDEAKRKFLEEQLLFPLRQRIMDLQQQLAVNQQGVLAVNLIIANNKELMRGVDRSLDVTVNALQVAVTVALALANQKVVLDKVEAINQTTSDILAGTAQRLKQQGADIQRRASSAMLDINALKSAFADIATALDEIARYRREALPQMAASIVEFDKLSAKGEEAIRKLEQGRAAEPTLQITSE
jgi:uncharacterized protein YaaN involved in tellurite resistance